MPVLPRTRLLSFERWPLAVHVLTWSLLPLAVLSLAVIVAVSAYTRLEDTSSRVASTYQVLTETSELNVRIIDMETGVRGFALSGDESFLQPYEDARRAIPTILGSLRVLVDDQPDQMSRLATVVAILNDWDQTIAMEQIRMTRAGEDLRPLVQSGGGKQRIDRIRSELAAIEADEQRVLADRAAADQAAWRSAALLLAATLIAMTASSVASFVAGRRIARSIRAFGAAAGEIAAGGLSVRLPTDGASELSVTGLAINRLADSLDEAAQKVAAHREALVEQVRELERARGEVRATLNATADAMVLVGPDRRFKSINRRCEEVFGISAERIIGRRFDELHAVIDQVFESPEAVRDVLTGTPVDEESRFSHVVRQRWPVSRELQLLSTPVHSERGDYLGRLYVFRDVTHEREVDRIKSEFVSLASHELRTPLTSIKGYADLLLEEEMGAIPTEMRQPLTMIQTSANRLIALVNDLLDLSQIDSGAIELRRAPTDVHRLIQVAVQPLREQIAGKQQALEISVPDNLPPAFTDADRTTQVLLRLISNAHNYTPAGGQITVTAHSEADLVRIDVTDTGVGISEQDQERLFSRFYRVQNRATREVPGTGLGLAISRSLVESIGGAITVNSEPGQGSTFSVALPLAAGPVVGSASAG